ncbi:MAG: PAC2 family protein [Candidatus Nanoarchaeia archaeon]|jgi:hypothetical protein|nr:PAC2 family protein [Candidatus Nanoarchaeia archaeon]|tara:strand:- start:23870 stop:24634 length:765 start_codon:yes stop_codon:yes gene_type:complete
MTYKFEQIAKLNKINDAVLIEGLPGIGNVGKIAVDFMIENLKAKKIYQIYSHNFPHAVFINENNLVELPRIEVYHKKIKNKDVLLLAGDIQPIDESSCYQFCEDVLDTMGKHKINEIVTIGGIGLQHIPQDPKVYCTSNDKDIIKKYKSKNLTNEIFGIVGPIIGVSGLLVGLAEQRKIAAIALLAETFSHPTYLGIKGAREVLKIIDDKLKMNLNLNKLDEEIYEIEKDIKTKTKEFSKLQKKKDGLRTDYIG